MIGDIFVGKSENDRRVYFIERMRQLNDEFELLFGRRRSAVVVTFGCQMNAHDSEKIVGILIDMGYILIDDEKSADLIVFNTCCVRENAENKVYGNLGYLKSYKRDNTHLKIVLCGCMMQQESVVETILSKYRHVDVILGTFNLYRLAELLVSCFDSNSVIVDVWKEHGEIVEDLPCVRSFKFKAGVNIMYGCNNFCSYCIVPYVRGRERSRGITDVLNEVVALFDDGVREITLLGQNVNSYSGGNGVSFAGLLREINALGLPLRIRFMTSHPKDLSDDLIYAIRDCECVCKHVHLPVQSGSSRVLELMNRRYTKESFLKLALKIRREIPDVSITTDIIVGFPGETDEDFSDTLDVVRTVKFNSAFTFLYSIRTGTPAASFTQQVPVDVAKSRFSLLLDTLNPIVHVQNDLWMGRCVDVLVEDFNASSGIVTGRSDNNTLVHFNGSVDLIGNIVTVEIVDNKTFYLMGRR